MSRRTKLCITALFLVLLAVPAIYIPLSWAPLAPFEFHCLGQGPPVMQRPIGETEEGPFIPFQIEVRNTQPFPMHLWTMDLMGIMTLDTTPSPDSGDAFGGNANPGGMHYKVNLPIGSYRAFARNTAGDDVPPIPGHGSMKVEILVPVSVVRRTDLTSLTVEYVSSSVTKNEAMKLTDWIDLKLWALSESTRRLGINLSPERHKAPLHGTIVQTTSPPK